MNDEADRPGITLYRVVSGQSETQQGYVMAMLHLQTLLSNATLSNMNEQAIVVFDLYQLEGRPAPSSGVHRATTRRGAGRRASAPTSGRYRSFGHHAALFVRAGLCVDGPSRARLCRNAHDSGRPAGRRAGGGADGRAVSVHRPVCQPAHCAGEAGSAAYGRVARKRTALPHPGRFGTGVDLDIRH
jgi:hypothetical protein